MVLTNEQRAWLDKAVQEKGRFTTGQTTGTAADDAAPKFSSSTINALIEEHKNASKIEVKSFKGMRDIEDVLAIKDEQVQRHRLLSINAAIQSAKQRQLKMFAAIKEFEKQTAPGDRIKDFDERQTYFNEFAGAMLKHIPESWQTQVGDLNKRIEGLLATDKERQEEKKKTLESVDSKADRKQIEDAIGALMPKNLDRCQFFFDTPAISVGHHTPEETCVAKVGEARELLDEYARSLDGKDADEELKVLQERLMKAGLLARDGAAKANSNPVDSDASKSGTKEFLGCLGIVDPLIADLRGRIKNQTGNEPQTRDTTDARKQLDQKFIELRDRARKIHDCGGTVDEVEKSLAGLPAEFWPPEFIDDLQAWRKVEREMAEERVREMFKKNGGILDESRMIADFTMEVIGNLVTSSSMQSTYTGAAAGEDGATAWMGDLAPMVISIVELAKDGLEKIEEKYKVLRNLDLHDLSESEIRELQKSLDEWTRDIDAKALETAQDFIKKHGETVLKDTKFAAGGLKTTFSAAKDLAPVLGEAVPILGAVAAGIDLSLATTALAKALLNLAQAQGEVREAEKLLYSGQMKDGGAMVKAMINERNARAVEASKMGVAAVGSATAATGTAVSTAAGSGFGTEQAVGTSLVVAGSLIKLGNQVVFSGINWGMAQKAKSTLKEAQAGNPVARQEIFEDSGLYAKMYIAMLAKEGNALATKIIVDRGYDEGALQKPAVSLKILRDFMLKDAKQKDERNVAGNVIEAVIEDKVGKAPGRVVRKAASEAKKAANKVDDIATKARIIADDALSGKFRHSKYDPKWTPKKGPSLNVEDWNWNVKNAVENAGLYEEKGKGGLRLLVSEAIEQCDSIIKECNKLIEVKKKALDNASGDKKQALIEEIRKEVNSTLKMLDDRIDAIRNARCITYRNEIHAPMVAHQLDLSRLVVVEQHKLVQALRDAKIIDAEWKAASPLDPSADGWRTNWNSAADACGVPAGDGNTVGKLLATFEKQRNERNALTKKIEEKGSPKLKSDRRKKALQIQDTLRKLGDEINALWPHCASIPGLKAYLLEMLTYTTKEMQKCDHDLNGEPWPDSPVGTPAFDTHFNKGKWDAILDKAYEDGYVESKKSTLGAALADWNKLRSGKYKESDWGDSKSKVKTFDKSTFERESANKCLRAITKASINFLKKNPDTHPDLKSCLNWYQKTAEQRSADIRAMFRDIEFKFAMECECSKSYWLTLYTHATRAGNFAIDRNEKVYEAMNAAWDAYESDLSTLDAVTKKKKYDEMLKAALSVESRLNNILMHIDRALATPEFDNDSFKAYLKGLRKKVEEAPNTDPLKAAFQGGNDDKRKLEFSPIDLNDEKGWNKTRNDAIKNGIILKSTGKGVAKAIENFDRAAGELTKLEDQAKNNDPTLISGGLSAVVTCLNSLELEINETREKVKHEKFKACLDNAAGECRRQSDQIRKALSPSAMP